MRASWVRRWFARQTDYSLWAIFIIWVMVQISATVWLISQLLLFAAKVAT